jgi:DNA-binding MarR family transcriptional regulator
MMDAHEIRTLKLLEAIEHQKTPSQRDLAKALGVSLGLVNSFVRRLAKKGYFKISHLPRNRIRYILTPKGAAEKSRLTYAYIQLSYKFYRDARRKIKALFREIQEQNIRSVAFHGTGDLAEIAYLTLQETNLQFIGISDIDGNDATFFGHRVMDIDGLAHLRLDAVIMTSDQADAELSRKLASAGIKQEKIITL